MERAAKMEVRDDKTLSPLHCCLAYIFLTNLSAQALATIAAWQVYTITNDPAALAILGGLQFIPVVGLFPVVGQACDKLRKSRLMLAGALCSVALCTVLGAASADGRMTAVLLYCGMTLFSTGRSFEVTASVSLLPELVEPAALPRAITLANGFRQMAKVAGALLAGWALALGTGSGTAAYALCGCLSGAALLCSVPLRHQRRPAARPVQGAKGLRLSEVFAGISCMLRSPLILGATSVDLLTGFLGGMSPLLPIIAKDVLAEGSATLGILRGALVLGSLAGLTLIGIFRPRRRVGRLLLGSVFAFGFMTTIMALTSDTWVAVSLLFVLGCLDGISSFVRQTLVQLAVSNAERGRVTALNQVFVVASNQLSEVRGGFMAAMLGIGPTIALGGVGIMGIALLWSRFFPKLWRLNTFDEAIASGQATAPDTVHELDLVPAAAGHARGGLQTFA